MTTVCRDKKLRLLGLLLVTLVHVGAIVILVKIFTSKENGFKYFTEQANKNDWRDEDVRKPKNELNERRIFHFLSKAASLEPFHPVNQSCSMIER